MYKYSRTSSMKMSQIMSGVLTVLLLKIQVFSWDVILCHWVSVSGILKYHSIFIFTVKQFKKKYSCA